MTSENKEEQSAYQKHLATCKHLYRHFSADPEKESDYEAGETVRKLAFVDDTFPSEKQTTTLRINMRDYPNECKPRFVKEAANTVDEAMKKHGRSVVETRVNNNTLEIETDYPYVYSALHTAPSLATKFAREDVAIQTAAQLRDWKWKHRVKNQIDKFSTH